jgi:hypothetical protein
VEGLKMGNAENKEIENPKKENNKKILNLINTAKTIDDIKIILKKIVKGND